MVMDARDIKADAAMQPLLTVRNLRIELPTRRGPLVAVDDVSFDIGPGEVLGVVGESGAGKSLTGNAVIGLLDPPLRIAGGQILLNGRRIDQLPYEQMRRIRGRRSVLFFRTLLPASILSTPSVASLLRRSKRTPTCRHPRPGHGLSNCWRRWGFRRRISVSTAMPTSSPAACVSVS